MDPTPIAEAIDDTDDADDGDNGGGLLRAVALPNMAAIDGGIIELIAG
jgi:hypothetical protein